MLFDICRIRCLLHRHDEAQRNRVIMDLPENLLQDCMITSPHLTIWQLYNLVLPCDLSSVLTEHQPRDVSSQPASGSIELIDSHKVLPVPPRRDPQLGGNPEMGNMLTQLSGNIEYSADTANGPIYRQLSRQPSQGVS